MKKLTGKQKQRLVRMLFIRARREARRKQIKKDNASLLNTPELLRIRAPEVFSLLDRDQRSDVVRFINKLKEAHGNRSNMLIDFSSTRKMIADGTLLFRAELCRLVKNKIPSQKIQCKLPHNERIKQVLKQTDILSLVDYRGNISPNLPDVVHWRTANGSNTDGSKYEPVLGNYEGYVAEAMLTGLYVGLSEAMTNTSQHAYIEPRGDSLKLRGPDEGWWMFSQSKGGYLYIVFCDLGIGISRSLPKVKPSLVARILKLRSEIKDCEYIKVAIEDSLTRTKLTHRGKGLGQIARTLSGVSDAKLIIHSNKGCYSYRQGSEPRVWDFKDSIMGTMISWSLPLEAPETTS